MKKAAIVTPKCKKQVYRGVQLKSRRRALESERQKLNAAFARLNGAKDRQKKAQTALQELSAVEIAQMSAWASKGGSGPPPSPDMSRREELARELAEATADRLNERPLSRRLRLMRLAETCLTFFCRHGLASRLRA
jgi:hypothetical protein